jgi:hypothetical protein
MLTLALELKTTSIAPYIIDSLLPIAQITIDLVAINRFKNEKTDFDEDIDVMACLSILHLEALGCMCEEKHITHFWRILRWDFLLVMLSTNQGIENYEIMLRILSTSVLSESFGMIWGNPEDQRYNVTYIIGRLVWQLDKVPELPMSTEKIEKKTVSRLRLHILQLMTGMTRSAYCSEALAVHQLVIARIVNLMSDEFDTLYDYRSGHEDR